MDANNVPQDDYAALGGHRKAVYAKGADGRIVVVESRGWEVEEIVNRQAVDAFRDLAEAARARVLAGTSAPLEYWMYARRMDPELLAQASGLWRWRVRRHLRPAIFARLSPRLRQRYADALGITVDQLCRLP